MSVSTRVTSRTEVRITLAFLFFLLAIAVPMTWRTLWPTKQPPVHTQIVQGHHLTFVLLAPTTDPEHEYKRMVSRAINAMSQHSRTSGYYFSTIGVSDDWSVERGLRILRAFGAFDEVIVGRNWFNTGVERYIITPKAQAAFPQVLVVLQERWLDGGRWVYGEANELIRVIGPAELAEWSSRQFAVPVTDLSPSALGADGTRICESVYGGHYKSQL